MIHIIWVQWFKILVESWNYTDSYIFKAIFFRVNYAEIWHLLASEKKPLGTKQQRVGISAFASSYQRLEGFLFDFLRVEIARLLWHIHECGHYLIMALLRPFLWAAKIEYLCESSTPEAEFSDVIETKVLRVFLLTIHSHQQKWFLVCNVNICIWKPEVW